jgi:transposase
MQKSVEYVVGIDISKQTFDVCLGASVSNPKIAKARFDNNLSGYESFVSWLLEQSAELSNVLFCLENTGMYHRQLVGYLISKDAYVWVAAAVDIKWSMGLQRGKSDQIDSQRIMRYAYRHQDKAQAAKMSNRSLDQLADLMALRERLITCIKRLKVPIKECKASGLLEQAILLEQACRASLATLKADLKELEKQIKKVIKQDQQLTKLYQYITSVHSVGLVAACYFLVYTKGFTRFENAKQFASYSGVAPFEFSSGTSVRGRTKVHPMANKQMKKILHMCAVSSLQHNPEMKAYFDRKVQQGKHKMLVLNAIRNKLIQRVFACVKNERFYQTDYQRA